MTWLASSPCTVSEAAESRPGSSAGTVCGTAGQGRVKPLQLFSKHLTVFGKHVRGRWHHSSPSVCLPQPFSAGSPSVSPDDPAVPPESVPPGPETPAACDPSLSFDAISTLRGEILFFKDRSDQNFPFPSLFFRCLETTEKLGRDF